MAGEITAWVDLQVSAGRAGGGGSRASREELAAIHSAATGASSLRRARGRILSVITGRQWEHRRAEQAPFGQAKTGCRGQAAETVFYRTAEIDRRGFGKIARGAAHLGNHVAQPEHLGQNLVVEHEVLGIRVQRLA